MFFLLSLALVLMKCKTWARKQHNKELLFPAPISAEKQLTNKHFNFHLLFIVCLIKLKQSIGLFGGSRAGAEKQEQR